MVVRHAVAVAARPRPRARRRDHGRPADLRRPPLGRLLGAARPVLPRRTIPADRRRRRAARLLQRHRAALGQPAVPLGPHGGRGLSLVDRARQARAVAGRPVSHRPLPRLRQLLGSAGDEPDGDRGPLGRRPGQGLVRRRRARTRPAAHRGRRPGPDRRGRRASARRLRLSGHARAAVRLRRRRHARLPAAQPRAQRRCLHGHARQRHHARLVGRGIRARARLCRRLPGAPAHTTSTGP